MATPLLQHAMGRYYQSVLLSKSSDRVLPASSNKFQHTHSTRDLKCTGVEHESESMHRDLEIESTLEQGALKLVSTHSGSFLQVYRSLLIAQSHHITRLRCVTPVRLLNLYRVDCASKDILLSNIKLRGRREL
jgi:hypothetical protein